MQSSPRRVLQGGVIAAFIGLAGISAGAHHGWSGYSDSEAQVSGTVETPVKLASPHASMQIKDADGKVWDLTLGPASRTESAGLKEGVLAAGTKLTAHGHRHKDPNRFELKTERISANGKTFDIYPDRD